jgi:ubiquinone/menaquinone biosynthesis C-methylase UbiE
LFRDINDTVANETLDRVAYGTVLDVGTGPGYLPVCIATKNSSLEVVGLDISRDMTKIARANAKRADLENVHVLVGDAAEIGMPNESVDLAVATLSFHYLSNAPKTFEELCRVLKRGGEVWIYEVNSELTPQSEAWMKGRYSVFTRKVARSVMRMLNRHTMTTEHAAAILRDQKNRFADAKVGQLEPLLVKITLVKK